MLPEEERLSYRVTWTDDLSGLERQFLFNFSPRDKTVEMIDLKNKKIFLRKFKTDQLQASDLYIGNTITVLARQLKIVDYGDDETRGKVEHSLESTFALIKPSSLSEMGKIISEIYQNGLSIARAKQVVLTGTLASELYDDHRATDDFDEIVQSLTCGPSLALVIVGENAVERWKSGLGHTDPAADRLENANTIRARFGSSVLDNVAHGSSTRESARREIGLFFPDKSTTDQFLRPALSAVFSNSTCCVILPHIVKERKVGEVIACIQENGFRVTALESFHLEFGKAEEFLEIYKNVVSNYGEMVKELSSGMCFALELCCQEIENGNGNSGSTVELFREFAGPRDPEVARKLRPNTLRARFGRDVTQNGVHCTDLPEDGSLEVEYFFKVLQ